MDYAQDYDDGYDRGYEHGYQDGQDDCECDHTFCAEDARDEGYQGGFSDGEMEGWNAGKRDTVAHIQPLLESLEHDMFWDWIDPKWIERVRIIIRELEYV